MLSGGRCRAVAAALAVLALAGACSPGEREAAPEARGAASSAPLALFTSLPLYWSEAADIGEALRSDAPAHWARTALEEDWRLRPLDLLEPDRLEAERHLLMIQPRPLSPAENVALDDWVARGGRLLLFADPALTAESPFVLGDRRRPQDTVLLSPILSRWGLELRFDDRQPLAGRRVALAGQVMLPVRLAGSFAAGGGNPRARCRIELEGLVAACRIGRGVLVAVADAALFEPARNPSDRAKRQASLAALTRQAFGR